MDFYCISISHQTTSLDIREKLRCTLLETKAALSYYTAHNEQYLGPASEMVILSTCNRFELYLTFRVDNHPFVGKVEDVKQILLGLIPQMTGYAGPNLASLCKVYRDLDAVEHLFRVAAGLESQVIGEVQIIGQVAEALETALQAGSAGHILTSLFRAALHTAKRAQTETDIGKNPVSLSSAAASIVDQVIGLVQLQHVILVGAGEMCALAARTFHARGARQITIINRTYASADRLANQFGSQARAWEDLPQALQDADVVVTATKAQHSFITVDMLREVTQHRDNRPLLLLDIALPRNIEPSARDLPGVTLYDLDDLKLLLNRSLKRRKREAQQVELILQAELRAFAHWIEIIPSVGKLHRKAEKIRQQEMERALQRMPNLDPQVQEQIDLLTRSLVKKLLHEPSSRMRNEANHRELQMYKNTLHFLFGLDEESGRPYKRR